MPRHSPRHRVAPAPSGPDVVFGRNPVLETMRGLPGAVERLYVAEGAHGVDPILAEARALGVPIETATRHALDGMAKGGNHQGVALVTKPFAFVTIEDLERSSPSMLVALDGILDPQNLGAIVRAAEVLGAGGIVLPKDRSASVTAAAIRASSGAAMHLPIAQVVNLVRALEVLKAAGYWIVGLDPEGASRFQDLPALERVVVVVGGEGRGMRSLVARACDFTVAIPVRGRVASLNASVAAAIALYELGVRPRPESPTGPVR